MYKVYSNVRRKKNLLDRKSEHGVTSIFVWSVGLNVPMKPVKRVQPI